MYKVSACLSHTFLPSLHLHHPASPQISFIPLTVDVIPDANACRLGKSLLSNQATRISISPSHVCQQKMDESNGCSQRPLSSQVNLEFASRWFLEKETDSELLQSCTLKCVRGHAFEMEGLRRKSQAPSHSFVNSEFVHWRFCENPR